MSSIAQLPEVSALNRSINVIQAVVDLGIALVLIFLLQNARTGFRKSDTMINRLIMLSMNTGLVTALCAIATLISVRFSEPLCNLRCSVIVFHLQNVTAEDTFVYILFYFNTSRRGYLSPSAVIATN